MMPVLAITFRMLSNDLSEMYKFPDESRQIPLRVQKKALVAGPPSPFDDEEEEPPPAYLVMMF